MSIDLNDIFTPSDVFLNKVGETIDNKTLTTLHSFTSAANFDSDKKEMSKYIRAAAYNLATSIFKQIGESPNMSIQSDQRFDYFGISSLIHKMMFNSYISSFLYDGLHIKTFYGTNIGLGYFDRRPFYTHDKIKYLIENRKDIPQYNYTTEFNLGNSRDPGCIRKVYQYADFLEVDTNKRVLYFVIQMDKLFVKNNTLVKT